MRKLLAVCIALTSLNSFAEENVQVDTVIDGLNNPCGIAIQPGTGDLFVSESGAKKIIRIVKDSSVSVDVITGFPDDVDGTAPPFKVGPLGLLFLTETSLVVGGGGLPDGEEVLRTYRLPKSGEPPISFDKAIQTIGPLEATNNTAAGGNYFSIAKTETSLFVASNGEKGLIAKSQRGTKMGALKQFISSKSVGGTHAGLTMSPDGFVVVSQMGAIDGQQDSVVTFYDAEAGRQLLKLKTELRDITALAFSPRRLLSDEKEKGWRSELLYALDTASVSYTHLTLPTTPYV